MLFVKAVKHVCTFWSTVPSIRQNWNIVYYSKFNLFAREDFQLTILTTTTSISENEI